MKVELFLKIGRVFLFFQNLTREEWTMSNIERLEHGTEILIDFSKLRKIYQKINVAAENDVIPVVVQDVCSKEVLILAYVNQVAFNYAMKNKAAAFWSTSRNELWVKGLTSGSTLELCEVRVNCEQNSLLYLVRPVNNCGACHVLAKNGKFHQSCFYRIINEDQDVLLFVNQKKEV